ncbi:glycosyl transferase family protein [Anopheles sinensis]|uniref:Glycosyl transferase family protein n=1 Tax=Anopheles sinensis TaxID=74873 RepID=A0A084WE67_ANOSI|nr:glycosyl transferase family protein [Anopheles sinensis]
MTMTMVMMVRLDVGTVGARSVSAGSGRLAGARQVTGRNPVALAHQFNRGGFCPDESTKRRSRKGYLFSTLVEGSRSNSSKGGFSVRAGMRSVRRASSFPWKTRGHGPLALDTPRRVEEGLGLGKSVQASKR